MKIKLSGNRERATDKKKKGKEEKGGVEEMKKTCPDPEHRHRRLVADGR